MLALRVAAALLDLVGLRAVDPALVREEEQPVVRRRDEEVVHHVVGPQLRALDALAAAVLRAVVVAAGALDVAAAGDGDDHLLLGDEVFDRTCRRRSRREDVGAPLVAELRDDLGELVGDDRALALGRREDRGSR